MIDFGLARELGGMDKVKCSMVGTLEFMAPEVARNMSKGKLSFVFFQIYKQKPFIQINTLGDEVYFCKSGFGHVELRGISLLLSMNPV